MANKIKQQVFSHLLFYLAQLVGYSRLGDEYLCFGKYGLYGALEGFQSLRITMYQQNFPGSQTLSVINQGLPRGVAGEIETFHSAIHRMALLALFPQAHLFSVGRIFYSPRRGVRVAVAHEENGIVGVRNNLLCQLVGNRVFTHHAAGYNIDVPRGCHERCSSLFGQPVGFHALLKSVPGHQSGGAIGQLIIQSGDFGAETTEVDRDIRDKPLLFESPDFAQQALAFS